MTEAKGASTPIDTAYPRLEGEDDLLTSNEEYRQAVGALLYIATTTRPDIAVAMSLLCRRVDKPRQRDWNAIKRVMRYLKHTKDLCLKLSANDDLNLTGYVDSDWAGDHSTRKSTSGYLFKLGNSPISWSSKRQMSVALSSTEAEYISAAFACQEVVWLQQLIKDLGKPTSEPTVLFEDNQACIKLATSEKMNARTKHIDVRHHYIHDLVDQKVIVLIYCESEKMIADAMTKPLARNRFVDLRSNMGLT
ncbi:secreted RxLR effector protein 161-like [Xenopus laevis]|uniref:Secreted RxLR effector protein 161-like n=1 Tax=Xenopus laevis TaxID=8355 RepID=A0A8J1MZD0_XENLA|nr:secreted RxLR effector protein 161-like [Xenopus laevis]